MFNSFRKRGVAGKIAAVYLSVRFFSNSVKSRGALKTDSLEFLLSAESFFWYSSNFIDFPQVNSIAYGTIGPPDNNM